MEQLLHYTWKHKIFPLHELRTTDGRLLEVLNPGIYNTDAGPDFTKVLRNLDNGQENHNSYNSRHDGNLNDIMLYRSFAFRQDIQYH